VDDRDLVRDLGRLIKGEVVVADLTQAAEKEGFESFSELCEARLPAQLARVRIALRDMIARIDRWRRREIGRKELQAWADELYHVSFNHRIGYEPRSEELVTTALSAIAIVANERLFPNAAKTQRCLEYVRACLLRRKRLHLRNIFLRIFEDIEVAHLANKHLGHEGEDDDEERPPFLATPRPEVGEPDPDDITSRWCDVVLLDRPFEEGRDIFTGYDWMMAFTVTSASLYDAERSAEAEFGAELDRELGRAHMGPEKAGAPKPALKRPEAPEPRTPAPEGHVAPASEAPAKADAAAASAKEPAKANAPASEAAPPGRKGSDARRTRPTPREPGPVVDRIPALQRLVPNFDFERWKPRYLYDGDGIAEIVLDAPRIGPAEVKYATKLFCLANRVRAAFLDGEAIKTLLVKPGAGRAARRAG